MSADINCNLGKVTRAFRSVLKWTDRVYVVISNGSSDDLDFLRNVIVSQIWSENKVCESPLISLDQRVVVDNGLYDCLRRKELITEADITELSVRRITFCK